MSLVKAMGKATALIEVHTSADKDFDGERTLKRGNAEKSFVHKVSVDPNKAESIKSKPGIPKVFAVKAKDPASNSCKEKKLLMAEGVQSQSELAHSILTQINNV